MIPGQREAIKRADAIALAAYDAAYQRTRARHGWTGELPVVCNGRLGQKYVPQTLPLKDPAAQERYDRYARDLTALVTEYNTLVFITRQLTRKRFPKVTDTEGNVCEDVRGLLEYNWSLQLEKLEATA